MSPIENKARRLLEHTINIRLILFLAFALLVVFISATLLAVSFIQTSRLAHEASSALIERTQRQTDAELRRFFDPITRQVAVSHQWLKNGLLKRYDTDALMELLVPVMFQLPQCVSMMVSDMTGYEFTIFRNESGGQLEIPEGRVQWTTRDFRREEWGKMAKWILWDENGRERIKQWERPAVWTMDDVLKHRPSGTNPDEIKPDDLIYDPRVRCWHKGPRKRYRERTMAEIVRNPKVAIYWTDVDFFFTSKAPGITAGIAAKDPEGDLVVVAYDLLLRDMSDFTRELQPSKHGRVFIFSQAGKLVSLSRDKRFQDKNQQAEAMLKPLKDAGIPELKSFMKLWRHRESNHPPIFQFKSRGQVWYASFRPFPISAERSLWTGIVVPESDLLVTARRNRIIILAVGLMALGLGILMAVRMSGSFSKPLNALVNQSNRIADLDLAPAGHGESRYTEFKQLSDSLEVIRTSLVDYITERKQAEKALRESEKRFRELADLLPDAVYEIDLDGNFTFANKRAFRLSGYSQEDLERGLNALQMFIPEDRGRVRENMSRILLVGEDLGFMEYTAQRKDGSTFPVIIHSAAIIHEGKVVGLRGIIIDISGLKETERKVRTLSSAVEQSINGIAIGDLELKLLYVNEAFARMHGYSPEEMIEMHVVNLHSEEQMGAYNRGMNQVKTRGSWTGEIDHIRKDGTSFPTYMSITLLRDEKGKPTGMLAVCRDITEREQAEEELRQHREHLEELVEQRTAELARANKQLQHEIEERRRVQEVLQKARDELEQRVEERTAELSKSNELLRKEITDRERTEEVLRQEEARMETLLRLSQMSEASASKIAGFALDQGIKLTGSRIGFLGFLSEDESVYTLHSVSKNVLQECKVAGNPIQLHISEAGIWADAIKQRKTLSIDDYAKPHPSKKGLPEGHFPIQRFMVVPVFKGNKIVAVAGVGNKPSDYDKADERQLTLLMNGMWHYTQRKQTEEALHRSEAELRLLSSRLLKAQENERKRIARELHDGLGQSLSAIKFSVENTLRQMDKSMTEGSFESLKALIPLIQEAIEEVRKTAMDLRPSTLDDLGILATISWFCREFQTIYSGIRIERQITLQENEVPDSLKTIIYRVLQEALNNVAKHSEADLVHLSLGKRDGTIELVIEDNGLGFDLQDVLSVEGVQTGLGLASMRERTELSGGAFAIESVKGAGTIVRARWKQ